MLHISRKNLHGHANTFWLSHKNGHHQNLALIASLHKYQRKQIIFIYQLDIMGEFGIHADRAEAIE